MAKKDSTSKPAAEVPALKIVITLPDDGQAPAIGQIVVTRGDLATVTQFTYEDIAGIMVALEAAAGRLIEVEANPPRELSKTATPAIANVTGETPVTTVDQPDADRPEQDEMELEMEGNPND